MSKNEQFFELVPGFSDFKQFTEEQAYVEVPDDWIVVVTDVKGSTKAIEAGRYRDVNKVGAATIAALKNAVPNITLPFVFGGDGATAIFPKAYAETVRKHLCGLRRHAFQAYEMQLRVGMLSVGELKGYGASILVGKFMTAGRCPIAVFRGGGLSVADELIKNHPEKFEIPEWPDSYTDLSELTCNWREMQSRQGKILSILFSDPEQRPEVYRQFVARLEALLGMSLAEVNPIETNAMSYRSLFTLVSDSLDKVRSGAGLFSEAKRLFTNLCLFKFGLWRLFRPIAHYRQNISNHSDYRKFDDILRMVIDCPEGAVESVRGLCESFRDEYGTCFGIHVSHSALMTCFVPSIGDGQHVHFVDGGNGGYAMAARELKAQILG